MDKKELLLVTFFCAKKQQCIGAVKNIFKKILEIQNKGLYLCIDNYRSVVIAFIPNARDSGFFF